MNEKAAELGLTSTHYADPSGLLSENVSSAYDMARLIAYRVERRAHLDDHAEEPAHHPDAAAGPSRSAARTTCSAAKASTCGRGRPGSSASRAIAWRRCCASRRPASRWPSSSSARARTPAASWKRRTCSTGCPQRHRRCFADAGRLRAPARLALSSTYPRCIAAASSGSVAIVSTATSTGRAALRPS